MAIPRAGLNLIHRKRPGFVPQSDLQADHTIPGIIESEFMSLAKRKAWERLIQKLYGVDPLTFLS
jgi:hypothetical protein